MLNATILRKVRITEELFLLHVKPDQGVPTFVPGQYVALGLYGSSPRPDAFPPEKEAQDPAKIIKRAYSIGSSPLTRDYLEFYIATVADGALTSRMYLAEEGARVFLAPKVTGTFTLKDVPNDANLVFVSTGTGIAPFMSMIRTPESWGDRTITVVHGVRYEKDLAYRQELEAIAAGDPTDYLSGVEAGRLRYHPIVSRGDDSWKGSRGHVQSLFESGVIPLDPKKDHVFLCGNPAMIDGMEALLTSRSFVVHSKRTPGNLHLERYW